MNKYSQKPLRWIRKCSNIFFLFLFLIPNYNLIARKGGEWPNFHGSDRINKSTETGLLKEWTADGPGLLFTIEGLGEGYSSVSIANGVIYTAGLLNQQTHVFAFDLGQYRNTRS